MTIVEQVEETLAKAPAPQGMSDELRRLSEFNAEMKRLGIVKLREYDLPLIDTIGRFARRRRDSLNRK